MQRVITRSTGQTSVRRSDRYELQEVLAQGGMGTVYRCYDSVRQRLVAYKRMRVGEAPLPGRLLSLFQREYDTLAKLAHPNIVEAYDYGFDAQAPYYTMELLSGDDLSVGAPTSVRDGCRILRDVASALALLHARRLVHRDVTPANVKVSEDGRGKLIDFGALAPFGVPNDLVGTPAFVAPECLARARLDQRTDLYGLGALAYWVFTRRTHIVVRSLEDLTRAWQTTLAPPSTYAPSLPAELDELVLSLLRLDREARPASAAYVIERLSHVGGLGAEPDATKVAFSYLTHTPLSGRSQVIATLREGLRDVVTGRGTLHWIEGEHGSGRTALLDQICVDAQLLGATVARADGSHDNTSFAVARRLVQAASAGSAVDSARTAGDRSPRHSQLFRDEPHARSALDASERQASLSRALFAALVELSVQNPLVLLIDDVERVDSESLALLAAGIETLRQHRILLVLSALPTNVTDESTAKLMRSAVRSRLLPLDADELAEVTRAIFGEVPHQQRLAAFLHARAAGNPGRVMELARFLLARGAIRYTVGTFVLPHDPVEEFAGGDAEQSHLAVLAGVSVDARSVAELLSLHTGPLDALQIASALDCDLPGAIDCLDELSARGAIVARNGCFTCASEPLRAALSGALSPEQARRGHVALARALRGDHDDAELEVRLARARHLLLAAGSEQLDAARLVAQAGDRHRFEPTVMARWLPLFERALAVLEREGYPDRECIGVLLPLSLAAYGGNLELQRRYLDRTLSALSDLCGLTRARRLRRLLGARLALVVGLVFAYWKHRRTKHRINQRSFAQNLAAFSSIALPATGLAACTYDVAETYRIAEYTEPLAGAPKRSGFYCMREFCLATAELIEGRVRSAYARYTYLSDVFSKPMAGMDEIAREQAVLGALNGKAYALVTDGAREGTELADQLAGRAALYRPHAECVRMTYHAERGEAEQARVHRERAEEASLKGGAAWSGIVALSTRSVQAFALTGDAVGLMRAVSDLDRLARLARSIGLLAEIAHAHLALVRGDTNGAIARYESLLSTDDARRLATHAFDVSMYVQALYTAGQHERAKQVCTDLLRDNAKREALIAQVLPRQKLALVEAARGDHRAAVALLEDCLQLAAPRENPLMLGSLHRDRAYVAAQMGELATFERHAELMQRLYESTRNPLLMQQCAALRMQAVALGLIAAAEPEPAPVDSVGGTTGLDTLSVTLDGTERRSAG